MTFDLLSLVPGKEFMVKKAIAQARNLEICETVQNTKDNDALLEVESTVFRTKLRKYLEQDQPVLINRYGQAAKILLNHDEYVRLKALAEQNQVAPSGRVNAVALVEQINNLCRMILAELK